MSKNATVHARIDPELKHDAESILHRLGLTSAEAVRLFYKQVILNQGIPFEIKIPNKLTKTTLDKGSKGEDIYTAENTDDLFNQLGI